MLDHFAIGEIVEVFDNISVSPFKFAKMSSKYIMNLEASYVIIPKCTFVQYVMSNFCTMHIMGTKVYKNLIYIKSFFYSFTFVATNELKLNNLIRTKTSLAFSKDI